jgi:mono/diheme cytochrome c family protein
MTIRSIVALALGAVAACGIVASAQEKPKPKIENVTIQRLPMDDPKLMFATYCAVCHGKEGKGDGPAVAALKKAPSDLTTLSARNGGTFPEIKVDRAISGEDQTAAHGSQDMPIWGDLFTYGSGLSNRASADLRVRALTEHLKTLQQ